MANDQGTFVAYLNHVEGVDNTGITTNITEIGTRYVTNLKTTESDDFFRFPVADGATSAVVTVDFGIDCEVGVVTTQVPRGTYPGVSEKAPALGPTDTIQYELLDDEDVVLWDSTAQPSGVVVGYMTHYAEVDPPVTARKLRVTYDAPSRVSAGFCDIACLGAWPVIAPNIGFSYPGGFGWQANTESSRTPAGRIYNARFEPMRKWSLSFDGLTYSEGLIIDEMIRYTGGARQVFVKRGDLPAGRDAMLAIVQSSRDMEFRNPSILQQALTFEEFI